jgi:hypothetical protein
VAVFCWSALERLGIRTETPAQCHRELSACFAVVMPRMSFSVRYTLSTPSAEGVGKVSRSAAATAMFWLTLAKVGRGLPLLFMVAAMSLAWPRTVARSIV